MPFSAASVRQRRVHAYLQSRYQALCATVTLVIDLLSRRFHEGGCVECCCDAFLLLLLMLLSSSSTVVVVVVFVVVVSDILVWSLFIIL